MSNFLNSTDTLGRQYSMEIVILILSEIDRQLEHKLESLDEKTMK